MMEFETWLPKFLKNEVSNKDITSLATKLNVNLSNIHHKCFSKRKRTVLRELLRQILQTIDQNDDEGDCEDDHDDDIKDDEDDVVRALQINGSSLPFERISITNQKRV